MNKYIVIAIIVIVLALMGGFIWWQFGADKDEDMDVPTTAIEQVALPVLPEKSQPGAYNGTLFTASEKLGSEFAIDSYMEGLNRNGVSWTAIYFGIEGNISDDSVSFMKQVVARYPGRIAPFYSTGIGGQSEGEIAGAKLTSQYQSGYEESVKKLGSNSIVGIGEVEITAWPVPPNDPKVKELIAFADENELAVMIHPKRGQLSQFVELVAAYPDTVFLMHHFRNDFTLERQQIIDLMQKNKNVLFTIDADHLMFSDKDKIGLLYKYQDTDEDEAVSGFVSDFDSMFNELLAKSVQDYEPLVAAFPDRVMVGTEMSTEYSFDPSVYDRSIKILRHFIGKLPLDQQESVAYKNAQKYFAPPTASE